MSARAKTADEWACAAPQSIRKNIKSGSEYAVLVAFCEKIATESRRAAFDECAEIANSAAVREDAHNTKASVQVSIKHAIEAARDKEKPKNEQKQS